MSDVSLKTLERFCTVFGVGFDYLLSGDSLVEPQRCSNKVSFWLREGKCTGCNSEASEPHAVADCIVALNGSRRESSYIARRFGLTCRSIEMILDEEFRIRRTAHA